jgi:hypothetical protein
MGIGTICYYSRHFLFGHPNSSVQTPGQSALFVFWQKPNRDLDRKKASTAVIQSRDWTWKWANTTHRWSERAIRFPIQFTKSQPQSVANIAENRFRSRMKLRLLHAATNRFCPFDDSKVMKTLSQWWTRRRGCIGGTSFLWWVSDRRPYGDRSFLEGLEFTHFFGSGTFDNWDLGWTP